MKIQNFSKSLLALFFLLGSACGNNKNMDYFLLHPEKIQPTYNKCVYLDGKVEANQSYECIAVLKAIPIFRAQLNELISTPNTFALNLMRLQAELVELQKSLQKAIDNDDQKQVLNLQGRIALQKMELASRLALIRLVTNNQ